MYAAANHGVYGATVQRSDDGGKTWERSEGPRPARGHELTLREDVARRAGTHPSRDAAGSAATGRRSSARPTAARAGSRSTSLTRAPDARALESRRRRDVHHSIQFDPDDARRMYVGISAAGVLPQRRRRRDRGRRRTAARPRTSSPTTASPRSASACTRCSLHPGAGRAASGSRTTAASTARTTGATNWGAPRRTTDFRAAFGFPIALNHLRAGHGVRDPGGLGPRLRGARSEAGTW